MLSPGPFGPAKKTTHDTLLRKYARSCGTGKVLRIQLRGEALKMPLKRVLVVYLES